MLTAVGLPTTFLPGAWPALREAMAVDKKTRGARMRFVVLDGPARPAILDDPPEDLLARAYEALVAPWLPFTQGQGFITRVGGGPAAGRLITCGSGWP